MFSITQQEVLFVDASIAENSLNGQVMNGYEVQK